MNDGLAVQDPQGKVVYGNQRFFDMLGRKKSDVIDRPATDFIEADNRTTFQQQISKRIRNRPADLQVSFEIAWIRKGGAKIPTLVSPVPLHDEQGLFKGSFAVLTDITELKRTETTLLERERDLENSAGSLAEVNTALQVLLEKRNDDQHEIEERIVYNVKELVLPFLAKIRRTRLDERQQGPDGYHRKQPQ